MRFIDKNVTQPVFDNNPQADQTLRLQDTCPDLWVLPLTCENSDKLVPTLDLGERFFLRTLLTVNGLPPQTSAVRFRKACTSSWLKLRIRLPSPMCCP